MKKKLSRIFACSLVVLLLANVTMAPSSKAVGAEVIGTSALATTALASYMTSTGVSLSVVSGGAAAASAGTASLISGYAAATGTTSAAVTSGIAAGVTISTGGAIIIGVAAAALLAGIVAWAISEYGVQPGGDPIPIYTESGWSLNGEPFNLVYYQSWRDAPVLEFDTIYTAPNGNTVYLGPVDGYDYPYAFVCNGDPCSYFGSLEGAQYWCLSTSTSLSSATHGGFLVLFTMASNGNKTLKSQTGTGSLFKFEEFFGDSQEVAINAQEDYTPKPELSPETQVRIETGVSPELAPEAVPAAVFESIVNATFVPSYEEVPVAESEPDPDPDPEPDSGTDSGTDSEILPAIGIANRFLERIALAVEAVVDRILDGLSKLFEPDPALVTEITDTFSEKFGFVPTLHQLGVDLTNMTADSTPPVIYIHLEDAEGNIDYGGTVKALDMSWYARYKADVDRILSGFLWLGFLWLCFMRAADIINGAGMIYGWTPFKPDSIDFGDSDTPRLGPSRRGRRR